MSAEFEANNMATGAASPSYSVVEEKENSPRHESDDQNRPSTKRIKSSTASTAVLAPSNTPGRKERVSRPSCSLVTTNTKLRTNSTSSTVAIDVIYEGDIGALWNEIEAAVTEAKKGGASFSRITRDVLPASNINDAPPARGKRTSRFSSCCTLGPSVSSGIRKITIGGRKASKRRELALEMEKAPRREYTRLRPREHGGSPIVPAKPSSRSSQRREESAKVTGSLEKVGDGGILATLEPVAPPMSPSASSNIRPVPSKKRPLQPDIDQSPPLKKKKRTLQPDIDRDPPLKKKKTSSVERRVKHSTQKRKEEADVVQRSSKPSSSRKRNCAPSPPEVIDNNRKGDNQRKGCGHTEQNEHRGGGDGESPSKKRRTANPRVILKVKPAPTVRVMVFEDGSIHELAPDIAKEIISVGLAVKIDPAESGPAVSADIQALPSDGIDVSSADEGPEINSEDLIMMADPGGEVWWAHKSMFEAMQLASPARSNAPPGTLPIDPAVHEFEMKAAVHIVNQRDATVGGGIHRAAAQSTKIINDESRKLS